MVFGNGRPGAPVIFGTPVKTGAPRAPVIFGSSQKTGAPTSIVNYLDLNGKFENNFGMFEWLGHWSDQNFALRYLERANPPLV